MPIKYIPKALVSAIIGGVLFMSVMPNSIKGMAAWTFYSIFGFSLIVGWVVATGVFRVVSWYLNRYLKHAFHDPTEK